VTKVRVRPKVFCKYLIYDKHKKIGYIELVSYMGRDDIPELEYSLDEEYRNKGIMTKELPLYIKRYCKKYHRKIIAIVDDNNFFSIKILEKNGFAKYYSFDNKHIYLLDLDIKINDIVKVKRFFDYQDSMFKDHTYDLLKKI